MESNQPGRWSLPRRCAEHRVRLALSLLLVLVVPVGYMTYQVLRNPAIKFLPPTWRGSWVVLDDGRNADHWAAAAAESVVFECRVPRWDLPQDVTLEASAFGQMRVTLNGQPVAPVAPVTNWKQTARFGLTADLQEGVNVLRVDVTNRHAAPALLVRAPAAWRTPGPWTAAPAVDPVAPVAATAGLLPVVCPGAWPAHPGPLQTSAAYPWLRWLVIAWIAGNLGVGAWVLLATVRTPPRPPDRRQADPRPGAAHKLCLAAILLGALALNLSNAWHLEPTRGPDAHGHVQHVQQVARTGRVALATDGWQAYHPPLYYFTAAGVYRLGGGDRAASAALKGVQGLGVLAGAALSALAWLLVRQRHRHDPTAALVAALWAAFLPAMLGAIPLVNNEIFAALVTAAAFLLLLHYAGAADAERATGGPPAAAPVPLPPRRAVILGLAIGVALLSKFSAALLLGPVVLLLLPPLLLAPSRRYLTPLALCLAAVLLVCGWYYLRNVIHFGTPFYGNWQADPDDQLPAYRWFGFYARFGHVFFIHPDDAQWRSWWDGLYASFWTGERMVYFSAWMTRSLAMLSLILLLGLPLTIAMVLGLLHSLRRVMTPGDGRCGVNRTADLLLVAFTIWTVLALVWFSIRVPANGTVTARYLLYLTPALAVFLARGRELFHRTAPALRLLLDLDLGLLVLAVISVYHIGILQG
ncbi:MAG: hypothetical protein WD042_07390 [Phycisphaeraceae bacterium]